MQRLELYVSDTNRLAIGVFEPVDSEYEKYTLKGQEAYRYLRKIHKGKVLDVVKEPKYNEMTLIYKNYILNLNEYEKLLNRKGLKEIIDEIKDYYEKLKLKKVRGKKVKRKNKYTGRRIAASGLAVLVIGTCAMFVSKNKSNWNDISVDISLSENFDDEIDQNVDEEILVTEIPNVSQNIINKQEEQISISPIEKITSVTVNYNDRSNTTKANATASNYGYLINKYATMYGIDTALALAVATQERGVHSSVMDAGGATGLMQIQNSVWLGESVKAYNFTTRQVETFVVTKDKIQDLEYNIKIGCMILQNSFQYMKHNILASIQCYNMGYGNMMKILGRYASDNNKTIDQVLSNIDDINWLDYRKLVTQGDQEYIEHVLSWIGEDIDIKNVKIDGELVHLNINNNLESKKVY